VRQVGAPVGTSVEVRDLFFNRSSRFGIYEAVLSVLGGNWRPSLLVRLRLEAFFAIVALMRVRKRLTARSVVPDDEATGIVGIES